MRRRQNKTERKDPKRKQQKKRSTHLHTQKSHYKNTKQEAIIHMKRTCMVKREKKANMNKMKLKLKRKKKEKDMTSSFFADHLLLGMQPSLKSSLFPQGGSFGRD